MNILLTIIRIISGGLFVCLENIISGFLLMISIVGNTFRQHSFRLAGLTQTSFNKTIF